ncbi:hypothetical protein ABW19_dt0209541 [Dactylella cylindrospora]|nr:hypothetical protein ABW19_dt0209541 [Dactylella cylindrospora]
MSDHDEEYGIHQFAGGDSLLFTTPAIMKFTSGLESVEATPNPYEETPIRPRRSKRSQTKAQSSTVTKTPASLFQQFVNPSDTQFHLEGTLFENMSPFKPNTAFNMEDFISMSPQKQFAAKTPAPKNAASRLNEISMNTIQATPTHKDFVFSTPAKQLKWGGNDENENPNGAMTTTKVCDPRLILPEEEQDEEEGLAPLANVKARSKPFSGKTDERSSKRQCSGEISPINGRLPLQDLDSSHGRISFTTDDQSDHEDEDNCVVLSNIPPTATDLQPGDRLVSKAYRNFTEIDIKTLKSFSPSANPALPSKNGEPSKTGGTKGAASTNSEFKSAIKPAAREIPPTPKQSTPITPTMSPSRIPLFVARRRGHSDPPALASHIDNKDKMMSAAERKNLLAAFNMLDAINKLETLGTSSTTRTSAASPATSKLLPGFVPRTGYGTPKSTLQAPTLASNMKKRSPIPEDKKFHRRSASEPKNAPENDTVAPPKLSDEDVEMLDSPSFKGLPDSTFELKKLLLETQAKLKSETAARQRAEETIRFMSAEREYNLAQLTSVKQQAAAASAALAPMVTRPETGSSRTTSSTSTTTGSTRPQSTLGTRATRPPVQATSGSSSTGATQRPPSRGISRATPPASTSTRPGSRATGGVNNPSVSSRLGSAPARPNSALSRQPVRRK